MVIALRVDSRLVSASKALEHCARLCLRLSSHCHHQVESVRTLHTVHSSVRSECWTPLRRHLNRLEAFHHQCIRAVLGITNRQQWEQHISSAAARDLWGDPETVRTKITKQRLEWIGHVARMLNH